MTKTSKTGNASSSKKKKKASKKKCAHCSTMEAEIKNKDLAIAKLLKMADDFGKLIEGSKAFNATISKSVARMSGKTCTPEI